MATVRVFLPTYRRHRMLARALASLRAQTWTDWICEVHNDDPDDAEVARIVAETGDARFITMRHERNLGGTATFNLFFRATTEPFYALHEDDNWWEPEFLATMLDVARAHPEATVFWANMKISEEQAAGSFTDTGRTVSPVVSGAPRRIDWGQPAQMLGAVHSNGAALFRSNPGDDYSIPAVPFSVVEMFRERLFPYPLVQVPQPLATFAVTRESARSRDHSEWAAMQVMLAATFLRHAGYSDSELDAAWQTARNAQPPNTNVLLFAALFDSRCRRIIKFSRPVDWWRLFRSTVRRPMIPWRILRSKRAQVPLWNWLDENTAVRFLTARSAAAKTP